MVSGKTSVIYLTGFCAMFRSIDAVSQFPGIDRSNQYVALNFETLTRASVDFSFFHIYTRNITAKRQRRTFKINRGSYPLWEQS